MICGRNVAHNPKYTVPSVKGSSGSLMLRGTFSSGGPRELVLEVMMRSFLPRSRNLELGLMSHWSKQHSI